MNESNDTSTNDGSRKFQSLTAELLEEKLQKHCALFVTLSKQPVENIHNLSQRVLLCRTSA